MSKLLKKQREDLGRDLKEVAAHTRIKESCLRSIEEEDYDKMPIEVYTRGYIKEYAKYLGMPIDPALVPYEIYLEVKLTTKGKKVPLKVLRKKKNSRLLRERTNAWMYARKSIFP